MLHNGYIHVGLCFLLQYFSRGIQRTSHYTLSLDFCMNPRYICSRHMVVFQITEYHNKTEAIFHSYNCSNSSWSWSICFCITRIPWTSMHACYTHVTRHGNHQHFKLSTQLYKTTLVQPARKIEVYESFLLILRRDHKDVINHTEIDHYKLWSADTANQWRVTR